MSLFSLLTDVLFIGHSLVGPTLPTVLDATLREMGEPSVVEAQIINGSSLAYNWDNSANAEGVDADLIGQHTLRHHITQHLVIGRKRAVGPGIHIPERIEAKLDVFGGHGSLRD